MAASEKTAHRELTKVRAAPDGATIRVRAADLCRAAVRAVARRQEVGEIHAARQALKRARALLRLLEDAGVAGAWPLRRRLAACARKLSPLRDAHVVARQAARLEEKGGDMPAQLLHRLATAKPARHGQAWWQEWCEQVAAGGEGIARLEVAGCNAATIEAALGKSVRRVTRRARRVRKEPTPERAHDWRKAVIVLREQLAVVRPEAAEAHRGLHRLSDRLGKATDATVLLAAMERQLPDTAAAEAVRPIRRKQERAIERARRSWRKMRKGLRREIADSARESRAREGGTR